MKKEKVVEVGYAGCYLFSGLPLECFKVNYTNMKNTKALLELICLN